LKLVPEIREDVLKKSIARARERNILLPTFAQQKDPTRVPAAITARLKDVGLWDLPANLFRITWKNEPVERGGGFGEGNWIEFPPALTGVDATIIGIVGKWFPTGAHKVGAAYGCLVPRLVTGDFDPDIHKAVWPSTGNYCRGGAYDCALLACPAVAILPEGMSRERFKWLRKIGTDEIIATPGTESNVKEIYDKCWELRNDRGDGIVVFNAVCLPMSARPAQPEPLPRATICAPAIPTSGWWPRRPCNVPRSFSSASASTGSRG
jgi:hypothetical protein